MLSVISPGLKYQILYKNVDFTEIWIYLLLHSLKKLFYLVHVCGDRNLVANLDEDRTVIQPPYPESYGYLVNCVYHVRSPDGTRIRFSFIDFGVNSYSSAYFSLQVRVL